MQQSTTTKILHLPSSDSVNNDGIIGQILLFLTRAILLYLVNLAACVVIQAVFATTCSNIVVLCNNVVMPWKHSQRLQYLRLNSKVCCYQCSASGTQGAPWSRKFGEEELLAELLATQTFQRCNNRNKQIDILHQYNNIKGRATVLTLLDLVSCTLCLVKLANLIVI